MIKGLLFLFFMFLIILLLAGASVFRGFINFIFGSPKKKTTNTNRNRTQASNNQQQQARQEPTPRKKIFNKDDGEYTDYEEVE